MLAALEGGDCACALISSGMAAGAHPARLGLPHNPVDAVRNALDKTRQRSDGC